MPRLMHPLHGWHVTSAGDDIEAMRKAGWIDDDGKALASKLSALLPSPVETPVEQAQREAAEAGSNVAQPTESEGDNRLRLIKETINKTFPALDPRDAARAELDALGIKWDARWGLKKLIAAKG